MSIKIKVWRIRRHALCFRCLVWM